MADTPIGDRLFKQTAAGLDMEDYLKDAQETPEDHTNWSRWPFAVTAVAGGALLLLLKLVHIHQAWVTATAIVLIVAYAAVVHSVPRLRLREDQLGDNCYYLGFLFTLLSLSWALWEFAHNGSEADIVANFGLALGSTIAGVLLRVSINQSRKDVLETEIDARMELSRSVTRLRVQIDDAALAMGAFHKQTEQIAADAIRASAERAATALDESIAKVGQSSAGALDRIETAFSDFSTHAQQLNEVSAGTVKGLKSLLTRIEKIDAPNDIVLKRLEPALSAVDEVTRRLAARLEEDEKLMAAGEERTRSLLTRFGELQSGLADIQTSIRNTSSSAKDVVTGFTAIQTELSALAQAGQTTVAKQIALSEEAGDQVTKILEANGQHLAALTSSFSKYNDTMAIEMERCRRMIAGTGSALAELAEHLGEKLDSRPVPPGSV
jgi:hypothetical protein